MQLTPFLLTYDSEGRQASQLFHPAAKASVPYLVKVFCYDNISVSMNRIAFIFIVILIVLRPRTFLEISILVLSNFL